MQGFAKDETKKPSFSRLFRIDLPHPDLYCLLVISDPKLPLQERRDSFGFFIFLWQILF